MASLVLVEEKRIVSLGKNQHMDITNDETWRMCRFSKIVQLLGEALKVKKNKDLFLTTFRSAPQSCLTYYNFQ